MTSTNNKHKLLTIMQQVEKLKAWHLEQQNKMKDQQYYLCNEDESFSDENIKYDVEKNSERNVSIDDQPLPVNHKSFELLIKEKLEKSGDNERICNNLPKPKRKFLRKGDGLARYRMVPQVTKRKKPTLQVKSNQKQDNVVVNFQSDVKLQHDLNHPVSESHEESQDLFCDNCGLDSPDQTLSPFTALHNRLILENERLNHKENEELRVFENLEERVNDSSFCSSSSLLARIMEESIKSTPMKSTEKSKHQQEVQILQQESEVESENPNSQPGYGQFPNLWSVLEYCEYLNAERLDVIDEEPSKLSSTLTDNVECNSTNNELEDKVTEKEVAFENTDAEWEAASDAPCMCSECTCSAEVSHFVSASVSIIAEDRKGGCVTECSSNSILYRQNVHTASDGCSIGDIAMRMQNSRNSTPKKRLTTAEEDSAEMLLASRLSELEKEIVAFREENTHLNKIRSEYENEYKMFLAEKEEFLNKIREERVKEIKALAEEKKKLEREKADFQKYIANVKRHSPIRQKREEIQQLKEEVAKLKEELNRKESRWGAAQARIRTQMRQLEMHNESLKQEVDKLNKASVKKVTFSSKLKKKDLVCKKAQNDDEEKENIGPRVPNSTNSHSAPVFTEVSPSICPAYLTTHPEWEKDVPEDCKDDYILNMICNSVSRYKNRSLKRENRNHSDDTGYHTDEAIRISSGDNTSCSPTCGDPCISKVSEQVDANGNREIVYQDGRREIWYVNGNVKKVSAGGDIVKTIYYNGDVKEVVSNGDVVKYYYAEDKTWHTTYQNGMEVIEFPSGQVEKRHQNGAIEITYPSGTLCVLSPDGKEKWIHNDGSVVINDKFNEEKIIILPDGQKEVHTPNFKKREYSDGTVKIMYADGVQETRYPNGRVRLKNKHGELISDTAT